VATSTRRVTWRGPASTALTGGRRRRAGIHPDLGHAVEAARDLGYLSVVPVLIGFGWQDR
jgi:hypothetical protein